MSRRTPEPRASTRRRTARHVLPSLAAALLTAAAQAQEPSPEPPADAEVPAPGAESPPAPPPRFRNDLGLVVGGRVGDNRPLPLLGVSYEHAFGHRVGLYACLQGSGLHDYGWMPDLGWAGEVGLRWYPLAAGPTGPFFGLDASRWFFHRSVDDFFTVDAQAGDRWLLGHGLSLTLLGEMGAGVVLGGGALFNFAAQVGVGYAF